MGDTAQAFNVDGTMCWSAPVAAAGSGRDCASAPSGATGFSYNANGQRSAAGSKGYSWNVAGELATSNTPSGSYRYDPEGLRVGMILGTGWRRYSWDDTSGAGELISDNRAGGETFSYVYGPDGMPCEQLDTNGGTTTVAWLHRDATGSVRLSTDSAGNQTSTQSYDPWGNVTATTGTPAQLGYDSEPVDPTGLIYLQARYYDPTTGQFLTRDPAFTATLSAYGYTGNDPVNGSDPTGLICGKTFGSGTYNPACLTYKCYLQNCTGSESPAHFPAAKCPHANEKLPGAGKTSYFPCPASSHHLRTKGEQRTRPPSQEEYLSSQNNPNSPEYERGNGPGVSGGAYGEAPVLVQIGHCVAGGGLGALSGAITFGRPLAAAILGCLGHAFFTDIGGGAQGSRDDVG